MGQVKARIVGVTPMLMNSSRGADALDPLVAEKDEFLSGLTAKTKKLPPNIAHLDKLCYMIALYYDEKIGPHIPAMNMEACLRDGLKVAKLGKVAQAGVLVNPELIPLEYDGPRDIDSLFANREFVDRRAIKQGRATIMRVRPRFVKWALSFEILFDGTLVKGDQLKAGLLNAGKLKGLGDFKPRFGRFEIASWKESK